MNEYLVTVRSYFTATRIGATEEVPAVHGWDLIDRFPTDRPDTFEFRFEQDVSLEAETSGQAYTRAPALASDPVAPQGWCFSDIGKATDLVMLVGAIEETPSAPGL